MFRWFLVAVLLSPAVVGSSDGAQIDGADPTSPPSSREYMPPVDAPVRDRFRPPSTPYGPGNRGIEYGTAPGSVAGSIGAGVVTFAGPVAGRSVVTVEHPDGLRSSLTGLAAVLVDVGDRVSPGTPLSTTTSALHLGVRRRGVYIDPAELFSVDDTRPRHAVLVPVPGG